MPFCPNCGTETNSSMKFCPNCGEPLTAASTPEPVQLQDNDYRIIFISLGTCGKSDAKDLLEDVLGYTSSEASTLVKNLPADIALNLTLEQAQYIAQAFSEYGADVAVMKGDSYVDIGSGAVSSVYANDGSFLTGVAAALALITAANRVHQIQRYERPGLFDHIFRPVYHRPAPPRHIRRPPPPPPAPPRRSILGIFSPRPAPKPRPAPPRPTPPRPAAPKPAPPKPASPKPAPPRAKPASRPAPKAPSPSAPKGPGRGPSGGRGPGRR